MKQQPQARTVNQERELVTEMAALLFDNGFRPLGEIANTFEIPLSTLYQAASAGRVPALQVGPRAWVLRRHAVELALAQGDIRKTRGRPRKTTKENPQ